jgi:acyl-CoA synthetase (AMP-forming)/AMP-acid ligase II/acyl carrier protein
MSLESANSVCDMLDKWAAELPNQICARFLVDGEELGEEWTFSQLRERSLAIAAHLAANYEPGNRALLVYPQSLEFIAAYMGCMYAGLIAVPIVPPNSERHLPKVAKILEDCSPAIVLTNRKFQHNLGHIATKHSKQFADLVFSSDALEYNPGFKPSACAARSDLAFLQYTSGSTGSPKGVMVTHGNLLSNGQMITRAFNPSIGSSWISWLPNYHDMGLIGGCLLPIFSGCTLTLMAPAAFLSKPFRWLKAVSDYGGEITGGPNFAFDLCIARIRDDQLGSLDLSTLKVLFNGAEPVKQKTLAAFLDKFSIRGFKKSSFLPCYGMAEATLLISGHFGQGFKSESVDKASLEIKNKIESSNNALDAKAIVACGPVVHPNTVICDPATRSLANEREVGEIWLAGPHVAAGYWNKSAQTIETFQARLPNRADRYLRTGDLGYISDGQLHICGRLKDLIIIGGRNIYPQDLEETAENAHPSVRKGCVAAFAVSESNAEAIVVVVEAKKGDSDLSGLCTRIRSSLAAEHEVAIRDLVIVAEGSIPKTTSGKIQRRLTASMLDKGQLLPLHKSTIELDLKPKLAETDESHSKKKSNTRKRTELGVDQQILETSQRRQDRAANPTREQIRGFIHAWLVHTTGKTDVEPTRKFAEYGLDSVAAVELQSLIKERFGIDVTDRAIFEYQTIDSLTDHATKQIRKLSVAS